MSAAATRAPMTQTIVIAVGLITASIGSRRLLDGCKAAGLGSVAPALRVRHAARRLGLVERSGARQFAPHLSAITSPSSLTG